MAQNLNVPWSQEDYITQVSEEIEGRVAKKLSQEFSRTENRILGALSRLDDFLMNPLNQGYSRTIPETSRTAFGTNQVTNEDDSQSDPHPEAGIFHNQTTRNSGPEDGHDTSLFRKISKSFRWVYGQKINKRAGIHRLFKRRAIILEWTKPLVLHTVYKRAEKKQAPSKDFWEIFTQKIATSKFFVHIKRWKSPSNIRLDQR